MISRNRTLNRFGRRFKENSPSTSRNTCRLGSFFHFEWAIALAIELKANWTLLDEREGRKVAKSLGLDVTGILGILLRAEQLGELESLQPIIDELINKAGFRIASELLAQILT